MKSALAPARVMSITTAENRSDGIPLQLEGAEELISRSPFVSALVHGTLRAMHKCDTDDLP